MKSRLPIVPLLIASALLLAAGCSKTPFVERPIAAATADDFAAWRAELGTQVTQAEWQDFDIAVQELKIKVMAERGGSAKAVLDEGMRAKINGKTFKEALILGFEARRERLDRERGEVQARLDHDSRLVVKAGDTASANYINTVRRADMDRKELLVREINEASEKLVSLGAPPTSLAQNPTTGSTPVATQDTR